MTDNEVMCIIIDRMISEVSNVEYVRQLNIIKGKIEGGKNIEEHQHPRFQSLEIFGINIFPFTMKQYYSMVEIIKKDKL